MYMLTLLTCRTLSRLAARQRPWSRKAQDGPLWTPSNRVPRTPHKSVAYSNRGLSSCATSCRAVRWTTNASRHPSYYFNFAPHNDGSLVELNQPRVTSFMFLQWPIDPAGGYQISHSNRYTVTTKVFRRWPLRLPGSNSRFSDVCDQ